MKGLDQFTFFYLDLPEPPPRTRFPDCQILQAKQIDILLTMSPAFSYYVAVDCKAGSQAGKLQNFTFRSCAL